MNVGKDPFPQDEVTGLAAFEHLEPVRTLNVVPDESQETAVVTEDSDSDLQLPALPVPANEARHPRPAARVDATLPLDLSAMPHWREQALVEPPSALAFDEPDSEEEDEPPVPAAPPMITASAAAAAPEAAKVSALDAMFSEVAGWDDEDEATRVHSNPAGSGRGAKLDVEWDDDDEPATEMRPFAMFDAPPIAARHDWAEWNNPDQDETWTSLPPRAASSIRSATPTIRIATPPAHTTLPPMRPGTKTLSGGRPSPFPAVAQSETSESAQLPAPEVAAPAQPLPAQPPPAAARPSLWQSATEHLDLSLSTQTPARFLEALKAGHRPSLIIAGGGVSGLVALVFIVRALASGSAGTAVLEVVPADAQVQVDGKPAQGTSSPYSVSELPPGTHEVTVKKSGYNDYRGSFTVTGGQSTKLPLIELAPNLRDVGFSVRSVPAGASVWLDGERTDQVTPAKLTGIKPGIHRLALKSDGYTDYELQMFVPEATVLQLPAAELVALPSPTPEPAHAGRRSRRSASGSDEDDSYSARRSRRASSSEASETERKSYTSSYGSRSKRAADSDDELLSGSRASSAAASGKTGTLRLNSRPWSQVAVDGKPVGNTPQQNLQLSAGKHKIQLSNTQLGLNKTVSVTIKAGETLTHVVNLAER